MVGLHVLCLCSHQHLQQESLRRARAAFWWLLRPHTVALGTALSGRLSSVHGANYHSLSAACQALNVHITSSLPHDSQSHSHFIFEETEALVSLTIPGSMG